MSYASATDLENVLGNQLFLVIADRDADGIGDAAALTAALDDATSLIDSYIANHLPLSGAAPNSLRRACVHIAAYDLCGDTAPVELRKRYEDVLAWLHDIATGVVPFVPGGP